MYFYGSMLFYLSSRDLISKDYYGHPASININLYLLGLLSFFSRAPSLAGISAGSTC